jgi:CRP-like cAMP-binding protein
MVFPLALKRRVATHFPKFRPAFPVFPMKEFAPLTNADAVMAILSNIAFLGGVPDGQRDEIIRLMEIARFKKGEYIARQGGEPSHIYIISRGTVDLLITDRDVSIFKRTFKPGDCFGEAAMLSMVNNTASFVAAEDSELIVLSRRALNDLRRENLPLFCILIMNLARELARKLQYTDEILIRQGPA